MLADGFRQHLPELSQQLAYCPLPALSPLEKLVHALRNRVAIEGQVVRIRLVSSVSFKKAPWLPAKRSFQRDAPTCKVRHPWEPVGLNMRKRPKTCRQGVQDGPNELCPRGVELPVERFLRNSSRFFDRSKLEENRTLQQIPAVPELLDPGKDNRPHYINDQLLAVAVELPGAESPARAEPTEGIR